MGEKNRLNSTDLPGDLCHEVIQVTKHAHKYQSGFSKAPRYCHITLAPTQVFKVTRVQICGVIQQLNIYI